MELYRGKNGTLEARVPKNFPFEISYREGLGRCLFATREIRPEETVLTDSAILLGPSNPDVCIVCCSERDRRKCRLCDFYVCSWCIDSHSDEECSVLVKVGYTRDMYNVVLPVRFALLQVRDNDMFTWLLQYMDHNEERNRKNKSLRRSTERMALIVSSSVQGISIDLALQIIGILFTNCFEFSSQTIRARALYPLVSLINHSCIPNLRHTNLIKEMRGVNLNGEIVVMELETQRTVMPGTQLTIRYNHYTQGNLQRQKFLSEQWFFRCHCQRCEDPTEFGTNTSGLPCNHCSGIILPTSDQGWVCNQCGETESIDKVQLMEEKLLNLAETKPCPFNITTSLQQLHNLSKILHTNHFILMDLKEKFLFGFSMNLRKVRDLSLDQKRKLVPLWSAQEKYCRQLLSYHEILDPGKSPLKTKLLLELRKILLIQSKVLSEENKDKDELVRKLNEVKGLNQMVYTQVSL